MSGSRELGEVHSYPLVDSEPGYGDNGYVLIADQDGNGSVRRPDTGTATDIDGTSPVAGVLHTSTLDQEDNVRYPPSGEVDVVGESGGMPVKADAGTYNFGDDVHLSSSNDGHVNAGDTGNVRVGTVAEPATVDADGDKLIVKFTTA